VVPLSTPAIAILTGLRALYSADPARLIFPSPSTNKPLSDVALAKALRLAGGGEATVHGLRSSFRDWCAEKTNFPREVAEAALAHSNKDRVEAAYLRARYLEQRRRLMAAWADFVTDTAPGEVVSIGRPGA
jgi:integrase